VTAADVVRRYWNDLWGGADPALVDELFDDPYVRHNRNGTQRLKRAELKADFRRYWASFGNAPEVRIDRLDVGSNGHVWSRVNIRGRNRDTDAPVGVMFLHEARVDGGLIVETWTLTAAEVDWAKKPR
jgi:hypothetical protein